MVNTYYINPRRKRNILNFLSVNNSLILINIISFIVFSLLISKNILSLDFVAIKPSNIFQGKYLWTLLTSMFMHAGFFHLLINMLSLIFVGSFIEKIIGRRRYFLFYILSGIFAGLFFVLMSLIFPGDFETYAVGASGALFGLIGLLTLLTPNLRVYMMLIPIPIKMKYAAPGMLIILWLISFTESVSIGNTAHLGGLIAGLIYAIYLRKKYKNKTRYISKRFS
jgi:membrane associated rhomboid family serine protease